MELIIDIQPFFDKDYRFCPKEIGIVSLEGDAYAHWIIKPPHEFSQLNSYLQTSNNTLSRFVHDIEWNEGDVSMKRVQEHLKNFVKKASYIYILGHTKKSYLSELLGRKVINVENYLSPCFSTLDCQYRQVSLTGCVYHKAKSDIWRNCALHKAGLVKTWIGELKKKYRNAVKKTTHDNPESLSAKEEAQSETLDILDLHKIECTKSKAALSDNDDDEKCDTAFTSTSDDEYFIANDKNDTVIEKSSIPKNITPTADIIQEEKEQQKIDNNEHVSNSTSDSNTTSYNHRRIPSELHPEGIDETDGPSRKHG